MILDNEQQKNELVSALMMVNIQGVFQQVAPVMQMVGQLIEAVKGAVVIQPGWEYSVNKKAEG